MTRYLGALNWLLVGLAAATVILVVTDFVLARSNRALQAEVNERQQFIAESNRLARIRETLIKDIANAAVSSDDSKLRELLARQGISFSNLPAAAPAGASP
jgi:hypothetical protein